MEKEKLIWYAREIAGNSTRMPPLYRFANDASCDSWNVILLGNMVFLVLVSVNVELGEGRGGLFANFSALFREIMAGLGWEMRLLTCSLEIGFSLCDRE